MVGLERTVVPLLGRNQFHISSTLLITQTSLRRLNTLLSRSLGPSRAGVVCAARDDNDEL